MSNEINGVSDAAAQVSEIASAARKPAAAEAPNPTQGFEPVPRDSVSLTDTAAKLRQLESSLSSVPVVDQQRVSQVREAVNEGSYQIDTNRIAEKMTRFEGLLAEVGTARS